MTSVGAALPFLETSGDPVLQGCETREYSDFLFDPDWATLVDRVIDQMLTRRFQPLGRLLPGLPRDEGALIPTHTLSTRARNVLEVGGHRLAGPARRSIGSWADLAELSAEDLFRIPNAGEQTVRAILRLAIEFADSGSASQMEVEEPGTTTSGPGAEPQGAAVSAGLRMLASWALRERSVSSLSDLFDVAPGLNPPDELVAGWEKLDVEVSNLADWRLTEPSLGDLYDRLLAQVRDSRRLVLEQRLLAVRPKTLDELGKIRGVTREAIRLDETKLKRDLETLLSLEEFLPFSWRAWDLAANLGAVSPAASPTIVHALDHATRDVNEYHRSPVLQLLLRLAGPYEERAGWFVRTGVPGVPTAGDLWADVAPAVVVDVEACRAWLAERQVDPKHLPEWLDVSDGARLQGDKVLRWGGSVVDKVVSLLTLSGEPASAEELVERIGEGHNPRGVRNRLFEDERLVRVDKYRFALREWGMEEYSGIAEEIAQRIRAHGGEAPLDEVVHELVETFGVAEASVRAYAEAPMFVRDGNSVRLRADHEEYAAGADLSGCAGVYRLPNGRVGYLFEVDSDVLRGSGRGFPKALAIALGVAPGKQRTFGSDAAELRVTWPMASATGPALGTTRPFAQALDLGVGDYLRLIFNPAEAAVAAAGAADKDLESEPAPVALERLTGLQVAGEDPRQVLGAAMGVDPGSVDRVLRDRGDGRIAALLPQQRSDEDLDSALEGLAELLGSLD